MQAYKWVGGIMQLRRSKNEMRNVKNQKDKSKSKKRGEKTLSTYWTQ